MVQYIDILKSYLNLNKYMAKKRVLWCIYFQVLGFVCISAQYKWLRYIKLLIILSYYLARFECKIIKYNNYSTIWFNFNYKFVKKKCNQKPIVNKIPYIIGRNRKKMSSILKQKHPYYLIFPPFVPCEKNVSLNPLGNLSWICNTQFSNNVIYLYRLVDSLHLWLRW